VAHGLEAIDWQAPWLAPLRSLGEPLANQVNAGASCAEVLTQQSLKINSVALGSPSIRFVPQTALPADTPYESHIFQTRTVPTRDGLHDFFNGLCWLHFPLTKQRLNALQAHEIECQGVQSLRGPVRDALTIFDENAAFLSAPDALWAALLRRDWIALFVDLRPLWAQATLLLFGHALLEKLVYPRKAVTAHVYKAHSAINSVADMDVWVANDVSLEKFLGKPFSPMPVLGVPHWWPANEMPDFYDDTQVFRPAREKDLL
jgi:hypothetical protein